MAFSDASHCSLPSLSSMESHFAVLSSSKARGGAILRMGSFIEGSSRKLLRTCRPSLASEALSLQHTCDLVIWLGILILEILTGTVYRELADGNKSFNLITPFGLPSLAEQIQAEIFSDCSSKSVPTATSANILFDKANELADLPNMVKTIVMTDSANAYSSILPGNPSCSEKQVRISLLRVRDVMDILTLSFIDKTFNLSDSGAEERGDYKIAHHFFRTGFFKVGFLGREEVSKRAKQLSSAWENAV